MCICIYMHETARAELTLAVMLCLVRNNSKDYASFFLRKETSNKPAPAIATNPMIAPQAATSPEQPLTKFCSAPVVALAINLNAPTALPSASRPMKSK